MNPKNIETMKTIHFFFTLLIITLLCSCSSDDDTLESEKKESFRVKVVAMLATQIPSSEGSALEVYGTISTKKILTDDSVDERILWKRNTTNWEAVGAAETVINSEGSEQIFTLTEDEIRDGALIEVYASLMDKDPDGNPDDFLGETSIFNRAGIFTIVADRDNPVPIQLTLNEFDGIKLLVRFTVEHIRD